MRMITILAGAALAATGSLAAAQAAPEPHQHEQPDATVQHEGMDQHQMAATGEKCCCKEMMKKMMSEMMQKHRTDMPMQKGSSPTQPEHSH